MKVLAFAASNSRHSINKKLIAHATQIVTEEIMPEAEVETLDIHDYEMPLYSIDRENEGGIPQPAHDFFHRMGAADALIISFAEHNGCYTAAYKNLWDWASRIDSKVYQGKPVVLMAATPGRRGGAGVLGIAERATPHFGGLVKATFSLPKFRENFDLERGEITDPELQAGLRKALSALKPEVA